jgi:hypothetical protein
MKETTGGRRGTGPAAMPNVRFSKMRTKKRTGKICRALRTGEQFSPVSLSADDTNGFLRDQVCRRVVAKKARF